MKKLSWFFCIIVVIIALMIPLRVEYGSNTVVTINSIGTCLKPVSIIVIDAFLKMDTLFITAAHMTRLT